MMMILGGWMEGWIVLDARDYIMIYNTSILGAWDLGIWIFNIR